MQPLVAKMESDCAQQVDFIRVDVDSPLNIGLSRQYNVSSIPRFIWLDANGKIVQQWLGSGPESQFASLLKYCRQTSQVTAP